MPADRPSSVNDVRSLAPSFIRRRQSSAATTQRDSPLPFVDYCEAHHADHITTEIALTWATDTPHSSNEVYRSRRLTGAQRQLRSAPTQLGL